MEYTWLWSFYSMFSALDLHAQIRAVLEGIQHERVDVRLHSSRNLAKLLRDYQSEVRQFMLRSEQVDPIVDELISAVSILGSTNIVWVVKYEYTSFSKNTVVLHSHRGMKYFLM